MEIILQELGYKIQCEQLKKEGYLTHMKIVNVLKARETE